MIFAGVVIAKSLSWEREIEADLVESLKAVQAVLASAPSSDLPAQRGARHLQSLLQAHFSRGHTDMFSPVFSAQSQEDSFNADLEPDQWLNVDAFDWTSWNIEAFETSPGQSFSLQAWEINDFATDTQESSGP